MVFLKSYATPQYNMKEILRYMGCRKAEPAVSELIDECIAELADRLKFKVCCAEFPVRQTENGLELTFMKTESRGLAKNLRGCDRIVLFAATVGLEIDRLIARYGEVSPTKSVAFQAIGAERIESLCDMFEAEVCERAAAAGKYARPRFSAGYGDFELSAQTEIFRALDCQRKIGLTLNDSLLMSPSKSVTAIIGISDTAAEKCGTGCKGCGKADCEYRGERE